MVPVPCGTRVLAEERPNPGAIGREPGVLIKDFQVDFGLEQELVLVLAVEVNQPVAEPSERGGSEV